jgi:hypothetical protein
MNLNREDTASLINETIKIDANYSISKEVSWLA